MKILKIIFLCSNKVELCLLINCFSVCYCHYNTMNRFFVVLFLHINKKWCVAPHAGPHCLRQFPDIPDTVISLRQAVASISMPLIWAEQTIFAALLW